MRKNIILLISFFLGVAGSSLGQSMLTGRIINSVSKKPVSEAFIKVKLDSSSNISTYTDATGFYLFTVPEETRTLIVTAPNMKDTVIKVSEYHLELAELNIEMEPQIRETNYEFSLEEFLHVDVEIASSETENIFSTPSTVSIIDKQMIADYNFRTVGEALETVAGVSVLRTYIKQGVLSSRGILQEHYANKVLILINGVPAWNAVTGEGHLDRVNIAMVERIEVLKGPASVKYGTNAYSGVVDIILKKSVGNQIALSAGSGSFFNYSGLAHFEKDDFSFLVTAGRNQERGTKRTLTDELGETANFCDHYNFNNLSAEIKYKGHKLFYNGLSANETALGAGPRFSWGMGQDHYTMANLFNYTWHKDWEKLTLHLEGIYDAQYRSLSRSKADTIRSEIKGYNALGKLTLSYTFIPSLSMELGGVYAYRNTNHYKNINTLDNSLVTGIFDGIAMDGQNNMQKRTLYEYSAYSFLNYKSGFFSGRLGARYTKNEKFKQNVSFSGVLAFLLNDHNSIKLIYGSSFRSPSMFETYFVVPHLVGNENLQPETSQSFELAYQMGEKNLYLQVLGYYAMYDNKIYRALTDVQMNGSTRKINQYHNGNRFSAKGAELELNYENPKIINALLRYNFMLGDKGDETNHNDHYNFKYVPNHSFTLGLSRKLGAGFHASALANFISETQTFKDKIPAQYDIDLNLGYAHQLEKGVHAEKLNFRHILSCKNLLNSDYYVPEYSRRNVMDRVPMGTGRTISYTLRVMF